MKRSPIRAVSKKRQAEARVYAKERLKFLLTNPNCAIAIDGCMGRATQVHHRISRARWGGGYLERTNWVQACAWCHGYVTEHPEWATEHGWMASGPRVGGAL